MDRYIELYHGSQRIIRNPRYGLGRRHNDYGQGFYCTENEDIAKEWAVSFDSDGFSNHYMLDTTYLRILNLNSEEYSILNWIAVLTANRLFRPGNPIAGRGKKYLEENFMVNVDAYDVVTGYRADDAYYDFANAFLNNMITVEQLSVAMRLGKLGEQIVIKSKHAFDSIRFIDCSGVGREEYYPSRKARSEQAELEFRELISSEADGLYLIDMIREGIGNNDERIPRNVP